MFISSTELSEVIISAPAPVLFLDTCIILDIIRSPFRDNISTNEISASLKLIRKAQANNRNLWLVTNEIVYTEWKENIEPVKNELTEEIKKAELTREKMVNAANIIFDFNHDFGQIIKTLNLPEHLGNLSKSLLDKCEKIAIDDSHYVEAMKRINKCDAPAQKGKNSAKDCQIFAAFLDIGKQLRNKNFQNNICFITTNFQDYGKPNAPKSPIDQELVSINAKYLNKLEWGLAIVESKSNYAR
ncbi:PIN domain-containing protein [Sphaerospermopsis torques-reginae]|uniref:PIN domain-containing protein n=1 Tax=Sphaerospermopsis torques-reginae ITEP-024 TaxID=984208 RepID=A0ABX8WXI3_9CYAN|nr:PIN domain-containing protein [Sphaerospermopsis torques-reginae]QYX31153.1 PIN domain-containing protein [Sphaerospermopsis torques-reginae ITEP-024]